MEYKHFPYSDEFAKYLKENHPEMEVMPKVIATEPYVPDSDLFQPITDGDRDE